MARVNNLSNFLTDVASAIKEKKGDNTNIPAANFDTEILSLPSQGVYQSKQMTINTNGNYEIIPDDGYDAIESLRLSVEAGEDLTDVLNTQDQKIAELEVALENKTASGKVKPNIFVQDTEPTIKDGIWLQTDKQLECIETDDSIIENESWYEDGTFRSIPFDFAEGSAVVYKDDIYLFGGSRAKTTAYKYNTLSNNYTKLNDIPFEFTSGSAVVVDNNIYIFGSYKRGDASLSKKAFRYDILSDTYTPIAEIPYSFWGGYAVAYENFVYLFGGGSSAYYNYRYNVNTDVYERMSDIPSSYSGGFLGGGAVLVGQDIFLFGTSYNSKNYSMKYSVLTDSYTSISSFYGDSGHAVISYGTQIYIFGGASHQSYCCKYDIITDSYTKLTDIPSYFYVGSALLVDNKVLLFGGTSNLKKVQGLQLSFKEYKNNSVVISQGRFYKVGYGIELFNNSEQFINQPKYAFADAWFYTTEDGLITDIPTYYGNGTEWVKFKN